MIAAIYARKSTERRPGRHEHRVSRTSHDRLFIPTEVRRSGALIGHVRGGSGVYRYYRGEFNELTAEFEDRNLDRLKTKIEETEGGRP